MKNLLEMSNWQILKESGFLPFLYILIGLFVAILALGIYMGIQDSKNPQEPYHVQVFLYVEGEYLSDDRASVHIEEYLRQEEEDGFKLFSIADIAEGTIRVTTKKGW